MIMVLRTLPRTWHLTATVAALVLGATACNSASDGTADLSPSDLPYSEFTRGAEPPTSSPECFGARGLAADGTKLVAALRLQRENSAIWGSYAIGRSAHDIAYYSVAGTVQGEDLEAEFRNASETLVVRGALSSAAAELVDPTGSLSLTSLVAGCD